jgi:UrcA family protein
MLCIGKQLVEVTVFKGLVNVKAGATFALVVAIAAAAPVVSRADEPVRMSVSYSDLNPNTPEGAQRLYSRLQQVANSVCGTSNTDTDVIMRGPGPCVRAAIGHAVHDINSAMLTKLYVKINGVELARQFGVEGDTLTAHD